MTKTTEDFVQRALQIHNSKYSYELFVYKTNQTKSFITCPTHREFLQTPANHLRGAGCPKCNNENKKKRQSLGKELFIEKARVVHGGKYSYDKSIYIKNSINIIISCPEHGDFLQQPANHLNGLGCRKCGGRLVDSRKSCVEKASKIHNNKYTYSNFEYTETRGIGVITCPIHGDFSQNINSHLKGNGCKRCVIDQQRKKESVFITEASIFHDHNYSYEKFSYRGKGVKGLITCSKHGDFMQAPNNHLQGAGCPYCAKSNISKPSQLWLDSLGIPKENREQNIFVGNKKYRVDAFNPETNTVYEFNGDFWHGNPEKFDPQDINGVNKKTFGCLYRETEKKRESLEGAGFKVISIWESFWRNTYDK